MARDCTAARTLTVRATVDPASETATRSAHSGAPRVNPQPTHGVAAARSRRRGEVPRGILLSGHPNSETLVSRLHSRLRERIGSQRYAVWFDGICQFVIEPDEAGVESGVSVVSDGPFAQDLVRRGFRADIEAVVAEVCGRSTPVHFRLLESTDARPRSGVSLAEVPPAPGEETPGDDKQAIPLCQPEAAASLPHGTEPRRLSREPVRKRPLAKLEDFIVGASNRMPRAAAEMVTSRLGEISPLLIYGPSGTGKTHLLEGILSLVRERYPEISAMLVPAEQFTTSFLQALHGSGLPGFRRSFRSLDILLVDDLQFFAGKRATAVELQQTFDALRRLGRQVICTCDREPEAVPNLGNDMLGRLEGGMSVRLAVPDFDVRRGIVVTLAERRRLECEPAVFDYLATHLTRNVRELTGGMNRLEATSHMLGLPISLDLAEEALADLVRAGGRGVRLPDIEHAVSTVFELESGSLQASQRSRAVNHPRMLAMFLARKHTPAALAEIGGYFGRRSHSTVVAARKAVAKWLSTKARVQFGDATWDAEEAVRRVEECLRSVR